MDHFSGGLGPKWDTPPHLLKSLLFLRGMPHRGLAFIPIGNKYESRGRKGSLFLSAEQQWALPEKNDE